MTPEPEPEPEPITQVAVTVKVVNSGSGSPTLGVSYNYNNNPDPYTATVSVPQNTEHTFSAYTVPVSGKVGFLYGTSTEPKASYDVTDAAASVTLTMTRSVENGSNVFTITDNLSRNVIRVVEVLEDDR